MDANILVRTTSVVSYLVLPVRENCIVEESRRDAVWTGYHRDMEWGEFTF